MSMIQLQFSKMTPFSVTKSDSHPWIILRFSCTKLIGRHNGYGKKKTKFKRAFKFHALNHDHKSVEIIFYFHTPESVKERNHPNMSSIEMCLSKPQHVSHDQIHLSNPQHVSHNQIHLSKPQYVSQNHNMPLTNKYISQNHNMSLTTTTCVSQPNKSLKTTTCLSQQHVSHNHNMSLTTKYVSQNEKIYCSRLGVVIFVKIYFYAIWYFVKLP
jgi:hypothetical protein